MALALSLSNNSLLEALVHMRHVHPLTAPLSPFFLSSSSFYAMEKKAPWSNKAKCSSFL
jgi:hypothetical protein